MSKVLVTGGAGFIGSHLVTQLIERGEFVYVLDDFRTGQDENVARFTAGCFELIRDSVMNIGEHTQLRDVETIYHLAAEVGNINSIENTVADASTNVVGTVHVCEFARQIGAKVVYSSSSAIYGESMYLPIDEKHPLQPASPYGLSKLTGELYVRMYGQLHAMRYVCLRYFNVYGEGQLFNPYSNVIPIFIKRLAAGEPLTVYGDGRQTRDFVHVDDVARANALAGKSTVDSGVYNVGTGTQSTLLKLLEILSELHPGHEVAFEPPRVGEVRDSVAEIRAIRDELGFEPSVSLEQGVRRYYGWMMDAAGS